MKNPQYKIDFLTNTITITKKFAEAASQMGNDEFTIMLELRKMGMRIQTKTVERSKEQCSHLTYIKMQNYIACVANSDCYLADFEAIRRASMGQSNPYQYVRSWFEQTFPNHAALPELDENRKIVVTPANYNQEVAWRNHSTV